MPLGKALVLAPFSDVVESVMSGEEGPLDRLVDEGVDERSGVKVLGDSAVKTGSCT